MTPEGKIDAASSQTLHVEVTEYYFKKAPKSQRLAVKELWDSVFPSREFYFILCTDTGINYATSWCCEHADRRVASGNAHSHPDHAVCVVTVWHIDQSEDRVALPLGTLVSFSDLPTLSMTIWAWEPFSSPSVSHSPSCVTPSCRSVHLPLCRLPLRLSGRLTQGITPTPNTAEFLKQTHFAAVKINPFLPFLSLSVFPSRSRSLPHFPLFSHSENKRLSLYLFYFGRPDHHRDFSRPFQL